jgi:hypothetical protein
LNFIHNHETIINCHILALFTFSVQSKLAVQKAGIKSLISCQPTVFKNKAKIYWEYNCNASWITFQKGKIRRKIYSLDKRQWNLRPD